MSTLSKPPVTPGSEPSRDEDPTGVRALLSSLPAPDPMPAQLVERINASLAAEQLKRAATSPSTPVTPLVATTRGRPARLWFAIAAAAAAIALVAVAGNNMFGASQLSTSASQASVARSSNNGATSKSEARGPGAAAPSAADQAPAFGAPAPSAAIQIVASGTRYTQADFVSQAQSLHRGSYPKPGAKSPSLRPALTADELRKCLDAIGAAAAQVVRADVAFYQGAPAVIVVATTNNVPLAYVVGPQCSRTHPAVLRPATPLS